MNSSLLSLLGFSVLFALLAYTHAAPTDLALRASSELAENGSTRVKRGGGGCGCGCCGCGGGGGCGCCCCRPRCCCRCTCCKTCCCTRCCTCCRPCCCRPCCGCGCGCGGGGRKRRSLQKLAVKLAEKKRLEASSAVEAVAIPIVETAPEASTSPSVPVPEESKVQKRSPLRWSPLQAIADITLW